MLRSKPFFRSIQYNLSLLITVWWRNYNLYHYWNSESLICWLISVYSVVLRLWVIHDDGYSMTMGFLMTFFTKKESKPKLWRFLWKIQVPVTTLRGQWHLFPISGVTADNRPKSQGLWRHSWGLVPLLGNFWFKNSISFSRAGAKN